MFPLFLNLEGKPVVVIGGGSVGRRKAAAARTAGATVRIVDPLPRPADLPEDSGTLWTAEQYRPEHLDGATLAFAAATPAVNTQVVADAKARGLWVNSATDPDHGDFFVPSTVHRGGLTLAIGTGGAAPALARRLREKLEAELDPPFADWVSLLDEMRQAIQSTIADEVLRRKLLDELADWPWLDQVRTRGAAATRTAMLDHINAASRGG